jgi:hypothetical protein
MANIRDSKTDAACVCPNVEVRSVVQDVVSTTEVCPSADDRKLIGEIWNTRCPENAVTVA